ncbi:hypothetical protein GCM10008906_28900 [Clostridium oceanicum]|uniref:Uncharacterized protein n=1 Tax=Clostridium oceanicum TaxID=1543 RepID=A0ABN1JPX2_9CLOT
MAAKKATFLCSFIDVLFDFISITIIKDIPNIKHSTMFLILCLLKASGIRSNTTTDNISPAENPINLPNNLLEGFFMDIPKKAPIIVPIKDIKDPKNTTYNILLFKTSP